MFVYNAAMIISTPVEDIPINTASTQPWREEEISITIFKIITITICNTLITT